MNRDKKYSIFYILRGVEKCRAALSCQAGLKPPSSDSKVVSEEESEKALWGRCYTLCKTIDRPYILSPDISCEEERGVGSTLLTKNLFYSSPKE